MPTSRDTDAIFLAAIEIASAHERAAWLDRACGDDAALRQRVDRLLSAHERAGRFMADADGDGPAAVERPGTRLGAYTLLAAIGEGGMGTVYEAEQSEPVVRRVALKVIKPGMDTGSVIARFEAERQALAVMDHPNIARVFDAGATASGRPFFVMELVDGVPVTHYCDRHRLDLPGRLRLFARVCRAVHHAHQKGIIHRDLKPANVLVADYEGQPAPKVIDFGIAKATGQGLSERTMYTLEGQVIGTLEYMSPEQTALDRHDVDTRSDVYSLGVVLYELLTGTTPFDRRQLGAAAFDEALRTIREDEPPPPSARVAALAAAAGEIAAARRCSVQGLRRQLRGELDWIVLRALEKDRNRRYESASSLAADLERHLRNEAVLAGPPSTVYRLRKFVRRYRGAVVAVAALLLALLLGLAGTSVGLFRAQAAEQEAVEARATERRRSFGLALDRGLAQCAEGNVGAGMLWLARALELCPPDEPGLQRVVRANLNAWSQELNALEMMLPHDDAVVSVAFRPDGGTLATGGNDDTVRLWDVRTGARLGGPLQHRGDVHELEFSADGSLLLTSDYRTTAFVWEVATGGRKLLLHHGSHEHGPALPCGDTCGLGAGTSKCGGVLGAAFRPTADSQLVTSCGDGTVRVWHARRGYELGRLEGHAHTVHDVAFSADGRFLLTGCHDKAARIFDFESRELVAVFQHDTRVTTVDFLGADGERVATGDADGHVHVWSVGQALADPDRTLETSAGEYVLRRRQHDGVVHRMRADPDGRRILSAGFDTAARLWDTGSGREQVFEHEAAVQAAAFQPGGDLVAVACDDDAARLWRPAPGQQVATVRHRVLDDLEATYSADGRYVLNSSFCEVAVWNSKKVSTARSRTVRVSAAATGELLAEFPHEGAVRVFAVDPAGARILLGLPDNNLEFRDAAGQLAFAPIAHPGGVWTVALDAAGTRALAGCFTGHLQLIDVVTGTQLGEPMAAGPRIHGAAFHPGGTRFAVASSDKRARVFASEDWSTPLLVLEGHLSAVAAIAYSRDGGRIVTGSHDNTVRVWDAATGRPLAAPMRLGGPVWYPFTVAFSPDGQCVVTGGDDRQARIWDVATAMPIGPALRHDAGVRMVAFTAEEEVRTGATDGTVRIWQPRLRPLGVDVAHITLWLQVRTGFALDAAGNLRALRHAEWRELRDQLERLGGSPAGA